MVLYEHDTDAPSNKHLANKIEPAIALLHRISESIERAFPTPPKRSKSELKAAYDDPDDL